MLPSHTLQTPNTPHPPVPVRAPLPTTFSRISPWIRFLALVLLGLATLFLLLLVGINRPSQNTLQGVTPLLSSWALCFLPYAFACGMVLFTKPAQGRWQWAEVGCILVGALLFRSVLLPYPPGLSHDSWRYLWDARVTLHGYSPYAVVPADMRLYFLRDSLYDIIRFRIQPTIYPPVAQGIFLLSYLIAPANLVMLKGIFVLVDMASCVLLLLLLVRRGIDPRRVLLYAWCPLPIVEFAIEGHLDALPVALILLALFCAASPGRGMRVVTGIVIGLATLTKIYPIVLLAVALRWRKDDWTLLAACLATIVLAYIPYLILGSGQVFGFFATYAGEQGGNAGLLQLWIYFIVNQHLKFSLNTTIWLQHILDVLLLGSVALFVFLRRQREQLSMEAGTLLMLGAVFAISSHIFSWYTPVLLPLVALMICPPRFQGRFSGKSIAILTTWYFVLISFTSYFFSYLPNWYSYYEYAYDTVAAGLCIAACVGGWHMLKKGRFSVKKHADHS